MSSAAFTAAAEAILSEAADLTRTSPGGDLRARVFQQIDLSRYDSLYGFGDSLADSGNAVFLAELTAGLVDDPTPPEQGYFNGRFSNGPNYFDQLYEEITGKPLATYIPAAELVGEILEEFSLPSGARDGVNFALGGSTAIPEYGADIPAFLQDFGPNLEAQVSLFLTGIDNASAFDGALDVADDVFGIEVELPTVPRDGLFAFSFGWQRHFLVPR